MNEDQRRLEEEKKLDKDELLGRLDRHLNWIQSCDTKASIVIAGIGVFITILTSENSIKALNHILSQSTKHINFSNLLYLLLLIISLISFIYGAYCLVRVLTPRLSKEALKHEGFNNNSLYYFEAIAKNNFLEFKDKMFREKKGDEITDILSQIFINAKICTIKYSYFSKGIKYSFLGIAGLVLIYVIGIVLVKTGGFK